MPPATRTTTPTVTPDTRWPAVRSIPGKVAAVNSTTFTWRCPATVRWRVIAFLAPSIADATGAPRFWTLTVFDQNQSEVLAVASAATLPLSAAALYVACRNWSQSIGPNGNGVYTQPLPDMYVEPDWTLTAAYSGAGAADQVGPANLLVEQGEA